MSDILSQSEIDALLSALTSGEINAEDIRTNDSQQQVRTYDFRRAMRFSKDHIRSISRVHENLSRLLTTHLSGQLRTVVQIQVESVDQVPYEEFIRSIPAMTVIYKFEFLPLEGSVVVEMNPQIVFAMLDRYMGGVIRGPYKVRELTEIERALLERIISKLPDFFAEAWGFVTNLQPRFQGMESNPQFLQLATPNETVLVVTLSSKIGNASGLLNVCIPHVTIEPLLSDLNSQFLLDSSRSRTGNEKATEHVKRHLQDVNVDLSVLLGSAEITLQEVLDLGQGDVIALDQSVHGDVPVLVNGTPGYRALVGKQKGHYAVRIVGPWKEESEDEQGRHEIV